MKSMQEEINSATLETLLQHMSKDDYLELVKEFVLNTELQLQNIHYNAFRAESQAVIRAVHSIKGNAISLGFDLLSHQSAEFEKALKETEIKTNSAIFVQYISAIAKSIENLVDYFNIDDRRRF